MSIQTSIIPKTVDLSTETDNSYISYPKIGSVKKLTFGKEAFNSLGLLDLRTSVLEANSSITGATDDFEDIFTDENGLLNTVNTTDTTSNYDTNYKLYKNPSLIETTITALATGTTAHGSSFEFRSAKSQIFSGFSFKSYTDNTDQIQISVNDVLVYTGPSISYSWHGYYTVNLNINLSQNDVVKVSLKYNGGLFNTRTGYTYPPNSNFYNSGISGLADLSGNSLSFKNYDNNTPSNKQITLNYNKGNPKSLYFMPYSSNTGTDEIGDVTLSLYTDTTLLGEFNPYQIYEGLTLPSTPNKAVINQKDTSISKITKYVLLIED